MLEGQKTTAPVGPKASDLVPERRYILAPELELSIMSSNLALVAIVEEEVAAVVDYVESV